MLRRALLTFAVLTYLTCVLILSGLQKSETEVNLTDSFHGGIENNTQDDNNEKLHRDLLHNSSVANMKQMKIIKTPLRKSSVKECAIRKNTSNKMNENNNNRIGSKIALDRRTVITFNNDTYAQNINDNVTPIDVDAEDKSNLRNQLTPWQKAAEKSLETTIDRNSIINNTTVPMSDETTEAYITTTTKTKEATFKIVTESLANNTNSADIMDDEELNNLLTEYKSKEKTEQSTTTPTALNTEMEDDSDIFNYLLNTQNNKSSVETHKFNAQIRRYSYEVNFERHKETKEKKKLTTESDNEIEPDGELNAMFIRDFKNLEENILNNDKPTSKDFFYNDEVFKRYRHNKMGKNLLVTSKYYTQFVMIKDIISTTTLPPDLIRQIAENVEKIIMKDFHKDIVTSTRGTTAETTERVATSNNNLIVIEKIMKLLQKYKTENNITETHTTELYKKVAHRQVLHTTLKAPQYITKAHYVKEANKANISQYLKYPYNLRPYLQIPVKIKMVNPERHYSIPTGNVAPSMARNSKSKPITIQTNSLEIPPLSVAVPNPVSLISHTIVISTLRPNHRNKQISRIKPKYFKQYSTPNKFKMAQTDAHEIKRSKFKNNRDYKKRLRQYRIESDDEDNNDLNKLQMPNVYKEASLYPKVQKFHEKLENYDSNDQHSGEDCCKDEIFTREQRPINKMKRRNDASFKNLLKTQQRVTDMLERLLAKSKSEMPLSVETT